MPDFNDLCRLVKSTDDCIIEYDSDVSGITYFGGGFEISTEINGKLFKYEIDLFPVIDDYETFCDWQTAKTYFTDEIISEKCGFSSLIYCYNSSEKIDRDSEEFQIVKERITKACKNIANQLESIADANEVDLDELFKVEDD